MKSFNTTNGNVIGKDLFLTQSITVDGDGAVIKHKLNGSYLAVEEHISWVDPVNPEDDSVQSMFYLTDRTLCISLSEVEFDVETHSPQGILNIRITCMMTNNTFTIKLTRIGGDLVQQERVVLLEED